MGAQMNPKERHRLAGFFSILCFISLLIPYYPTLYSKFEISSLSETAIALFCYGLAILFFGCFFLIEIREKIKMIFSFILFLAPIVYIAALPFMHEAGVKMYLDKNQHKINNLITEIKKHEQVTDFNSYSYENFLKANKSDSVIMTKAEYEKLN
jgi:hypothetical protein